MKEALIELAKWCPRCKGERTIMIFEDTSLHEHNTYIVPCPQCEVLWSLLGGNVD